VFFAHLGVIDVLLEIAQGKTDSSDRLTAGESNTGVVLLC